MFSFRKWEEDIILIKKCSLYYKLCERLSYFSRYESLELPYNSPHQDVLFPVSIEAIQMVMMTWRFLSMGICQVQTGPNQPESKEFLTLWATQSKEEVDGRKGPGKMKLDK